MKEKIACVLPLLLKWVRQAMKESGGTKAIIGVSGGKDSSVTAALMTKALGKENVVGISLPNGHQYDIDYAEDLVEFLGIEYHVINIEKMVLAAEEGVRSIAELSKDTHINIPPRVRMTVLYGLSQSIPGARVINTSNLSEDWVGYATIYGDTAGAFSPLGCFTTDEVIEIGRQLGVPEKYLVKVPEDGLTGLSDEEKLGFTYDELNRYIRTGEIENEETKKVIDRMHQLSRFKFEVLPMFPAPFPIVPKDIAKVYPW